MTTVDNGTVDTGTVAELAELAGTWTVDAAHSLVAFSVVHMTIARVTGRFDVLDGEVDVTASAASLRVRVATASVSSGHPKRDELIRSADFLDSARFPELEFTASATGFSAGDWTLPGLLSIRGVARPVELAVRTGGVVEHRGATRAGFSARTTLDRREFGLRFDGLLAGGGAVVSNRVDVVIEAELVRA
ncbi:YceI family protein [Amycolatopsis rhabdoformis]|uniref:YceI family protein n=1 Tax=Amycolatopsis rhabdoformis TaxID=1448059 RepID=A0ABZ1ICN1_9PSEU|nr:YceI family protein [Amycolatopsis rhabdoformis]WSE32002.1 YceI family protein [Amycolatopsis rhabdoformis]